MWQAVIFKESSGRFAKRDTIQLRSSCRQGNEQKRSAQLPKFSTSWRGRSSSGSPYCWLLEGASLVILQVSLQQSINGEFHSSKCRQRSWLKWIPASAEKPAWTIDWERT